MHAVDLYDRRGVYFDTRHFEALGKTVVVPVPGRFLSVRYRTFTVFRYLAGDGTRVYYGLEE